MPNTMVVKELSGLTTANYPVQFARPFVQGEIANFPRPLIDTVPAAAWQADVKQRYSDGSVKHAILSFLIPSLAANASKTITFDNQAANNHTGVSDSGHLSASGMTSGSYALFDARVQIQSGKSIQEVKARDMVLAGKFKYWTRGPVCTTVIVADHVAYSAARPYDMGFDAHKSLRPIFHCAFWPTASRAKVRVRVIGENANSEAMQDLSYDLTISLATTGRIAYQKNGFYHNGATRWTKTFWLCGVPGEIHIDHNLAYLSSTKMIYNFDPSLVAAAALPVSYIDALHSRWLNADKDFLFDAGLYWPNTMAGGVHPELGPVPNWDALWLFSMGNINFPGDTSQPWRAKQILDSQMDLIGAFPTHVREYDATKKIVRSDAAGSGIGRIMTNGDRPTIGYSSVAANDQIDTPATGTWTDRCSRHMENSSVICSGANPPPDALHPGTDRWSMDNSHLFDPHTLFVTSGDYWHLEEVWFHNAWSVINTPNVQPQDGISRGPHPSDGPYADGYGGALDLNANSCRAAARQLVARVNCTYITPDLNTYLFNPDGSVYQCREKDYWTLMTEDALACEVGGHIIAGSVYENAAHASNQLYLFGLRHRRYRSGEPDPGAPPFLKMFYRGNTGLADQPDLLSSETTWASIMEHFMLYALGRAAELGYAGASSLLAYLAEHWIGRVNSGTNPYNIAGALRTPTIARSTNTWFATFDHLNLGFVPDLQVNRSSFFTYPGYLLASQRPAELVPGYALSYSQPGGAAAWNFLKTQFVDQVGPDLNNQGLKWRIFPRV